MEKNVKSSKQEKLQRNKEICNEIIKIFSDRKLNYAEAKGILSDVSYELGKRSERNLI